MEELLKELEEVKQKIADIEKKIEEKKAEIGRWKPEEGDIYWFISDVGCICSSKWDNDYIDRERYLTSNYYRTKEECEFTKEKLKVIAELKEYAEPKNRVWDGANRHYYFYYTYAKKEIGITCDYSFKSEHIYFESEEKARQAMNAVGEDKIKKYFLEVEE